jgi:hypothetical protein
MRTAPGHPSRTRRPTAWRVGAAALGAVGVGAATLAGCSDDQAADAGDVGDLVTVAESDDLGRAIDMAAAPGGVWLVLEDGRVVTVPAGSGRSGDGQGDEGDGAVEPARFGPVAPDAGISAADGGVLVAAAPDRQRLLIVRDGEAATVRVDGVQEMSRVAAAGGGTLYFADHTGPRVVTTEAGSAEGPARSVLDGVLAAPLSGGPGGELYFVDDQVLGGRIRVTDAGGDARTITGEVERDEEGEPVERPSDGGDAAESYMDALDLAAAGDALYVLTFDNEVWRIADGQLELVLRRGGDAALVSLAANEDDVYVLDTATATLSSLG